MVSVNDLDVAVFTKQSKLFELLDDGGRRRMLAAAQPVHIASGAAIVHEGEAGTTLFIVTSGMIKIGITTPAGTEMVLALLTVTSLRG